MLWSEPTTGKNLTGSFGGTLPTALFFVAVVARPLKTRSSRLTHLVVGRRLQTQSREVVLKNGKGR